MDLFPPRHGWKEREKKPACENTGVLDLEHFHQSAWEISLPRWKFLVVPWSAVGIILVTSWILMFQFNRDFNELLRLFYLISKKEVPSHPSTSIYPSVTHPHKPLGDPGLPQLRQVQRQSALMHHQNPKHHKWYVDPGWSPPGNSCFSLHTIVYATSCFEAAKGAASWATRWRTDDKINRACKWFSASQPNAPSSSPERTRTYQEDLLPYASVQDPLRIPDFNCPESANIQLFDIRLQNTHSLSNVYEYVPTLATNTGSVPKIPTEVSQLNEFSTNEKPLWILIFHHFV